MSPLGLRALSFYNPAALDDDVLRAGYLARPEVLADLVAQLRKENHESVAEHQLIIGQRGMGKTTLLRRLGLAVREEAELEIHFLPLTFPEEQYSVSSLKDFWRNCLDALIDTLEARRIGDPQAMQHAQNTLEDPAQGADVALQVLLTAQQTLQRRLLLLVDNLDLVFERLDERESWALRAALQRPGGPILYAAATHAPEDGFRYDRAFYDFLQLRWLEALSFDEVRTLLDALAQRHQLEALRNELANNPQRLIPLQLFTGGNPRTVMLLFRVLAQGMDEGVQKDVEDLLDLCTPLYKARLEALPLQQQRVFIAVALAFDPVTAAQMEKQLKLGINTVSAQLAKLLKAGLLRHGPSIGKRHSFEVAERFFNIWYLMRANRRERHRMLWLAKFLRSWYAQEPQQLVSTAERLLRDDSRPAVAHAVLEMTAGIEDALPLRQRALQHLPEEQRGFYPELCGTITGQLAEASALTDTEWVITSTAFSRRMRGYYDWALPLLREAKVALESLRDQGHARKVINHLLSQPQRCVELLQAEAPGPLRDLGLAIAYRRMPEQRSHAETLLRRVLAQHSDSVAAWNTMGLLLASQTTRMDEAENAYRRAIELDATLALPWNNLGLLLAKQKGRTDEAEDAYRRAIELDATFAWPWNNLGHLLAEQTGRNGEAEAAYRRAIELDAALALPWNNLGLLLAKQNGRTDEAEDAYRRAIELDAAFAWPWNNLGNLLAKKMGRTDEAEAAYRRAIELDAAYANPWSNLGLLLAKQTTRTDEAEYACRRAIELDADFAWAWNNLGNLLAEQTTRTDEAEDAYHRAIELNTNFAWPWNNLGNLLAEQTTRTDEAEDAYRRAIELDAAYANPWNNLGLLLAEQTTRTDEAEAAYRRAIELDATSPNPWTDLVHLWWTLDRPQRGPQGVAQLQPLFQLAAKAEARSEVVEPLLQWLMESGRSTDLWRALQQSGYVTQLLEQARPLAEAIRMLAEDVPTHITTLAAEVREATYRVLQRVAPSFAERIARELPALVASFTLPERIAPLPPGAS